MFISDHETILSAKKVSQIVETNNQKTESVQLPPEFFIYIKKRSEKKKTQGGQTFFLRVMKEEGKDVLAEVLNILEDAWIKGRSDGSLGKKYKVSSDTIYRLRKELEQFKEIVIEHLKTTDRVKRWYVKESDMSDYETIQTYIFRARRDGLVRYKENIEVARHVWKFLNQRDPSTWNADDVMSFLNLKSKGAQSRYLDAIRQVAPQIRDGSSKDAIGTSRFRAKLGRRRKDIFGQDVKLIKIALEEHDKKEEDDIATKWMFHITTASREGYRVEGAGLCGITFARFKMDFTRVDLYESKVRGGIWWRDCPVDLFFPHLPELIKALWKKRGKPTDEKLIFGGTSEVKEMYKKIRKILVEKYKGQIEPSLLKEFETMRPHDADKIHVNLLWEAGVPLEIVGGQDLGGSEGVGLMGRGWLDVNVIKKYYLSMTARSERFKAVRDQVTLYSKQFNGGS